jgi:hypothetical protein
MAILSSTRVLTHDYWKLAKDLVPGDYVFDRYGKPVQVTLVQPIQAQACYEVTFNDYLTISGNERLALPLEDRRYRYRSDAIKRNPFKRPLKVKSIAQLLEEPLVDYRNRKKYSVPTTDPIQLPYQDLPVPPFVFGFWFFAKQHDKTMVASKGNGEFVREKFKDLGYKPKDRSFTRSGERKFLTNPTVVSHLIPSVPNTIPENYLLAHKDQRFDLLQGILCTNTAKYHEKTKTYRVVQRSKRLIYMIQYLADSLGCKTEMRRSDLSGQFILHIKTKQPLLPTKQPSLPTKQHSKHMARRFVKEIAPIKAQMCTHIETDGDDHTILVGEGFIACH